MRARQMFVELSATVRADYGNGRGEETHCGEVLLLLRQLLSSSVS